MSVDSNLEIRGKSEDESKGPDVRLSIACGYCSRNIATCVKSSKPASPIINPDEKETSPPKETSGEREPGNDVKKESEKKRVDKNSSIVTASSPIDEPCHCLKPRARCSICLARLNTPATLHLFRGKSDLDGYGGVKLSSYDTSLSTPSSDPVVVRNPFASFTVFCATCRHSGHASHYLDWFKTNNNCPVSGCTCQCSSLDQMIRRESIIHQS